MAKGNSSLAQMSVDALLKLRDDVGEMLSRKAHDLRQQLTRLAGGGAPKAKNGRRGKAHALKGAKVAPKYRDPKSGATWAGRGAKPRWMQAYIKEGRSPGDFAIAVTGSAGRPARKKTAKKK